jgi:hypothetical protein
MRAKASVPRFAPRLPDNAVVGRANQNRVLDTIMTDPALSSTTKTVAWAVNKHLNGETGWTWAGNDTIAKDLAMDRSSALRHLAALEGGVPAGISKRAPRRSKPYVYSFKFGPQGHERVYRCFLEPDWVSSSGGATSPLEDLQTVA